MGTKYYLKLTFRAILTSIFLLFCGVNMYRLKVKEYGSRSFTQKKEPDSFPSIAICPFQYSPKVNQVFMEQNNTFSDVMKLPSLRDHIFIDVEITKPYVKA